MYEVSDQGRVRSLHWRKPRIRKIVTTGRYPMIMLKQDGRLWNVEVHSLVARAFHGERPEGMEVAHENGVAYDVRAANLSYKTKQQNDADKVRHGTIPRELMLPQTKLSDLQVREIRERVRSGAQQSHLALQFSVSKQHISDIVRGKKRQSA